jgi:hypothetical protein
MPSIFLSHTSVDKPFVEKLARDLRRLGINVWFDKWEIKVGESITWKIEEGIREHEYLGIVLSPDALRSEWVKSELSAAWTRQMRTKKIGVLPILYRDCEIPLFLSDRKYADFRDDYQVGLQALAGVLGISETETINRDNWRRFAKQRKGNWQEFRKKEFEELVTVLVDRALEYNWSSWVGGKQNPFSITLHAWIDRERAESISVKLKGRTYAYMATFEDVINPSNLKVSAFDIYVGNTINECEEFIWRRMEDFRRKFGDPVEDVYHHVGKFLSDDEKAELARKVVKEVNWYKGENLF